MQWVGPSKNGFSPWKAIVVGALVIELVAIVVLVRGREEGTTNSPRASKVDTARFDDTGLPYSFEYPEGWEVEKERAVTKLLSPGNDIAIAVGPAPTGDVLASSDRLVDGLTDRYSEAHSKSRGLTRVGGNLGVTVKGTAVNGFGVPVRFAIVTIEADDGENYAITSFATADGRRTADKTLQEVLDNFELRSS